MTRRSLGAVVANSIVWGYAFLILGPTLWVLSNAFKYKIDIITGATFSPFTWINFQELLFSRQSDFLMNLFNSAVIGVASTAIVIVIATMAAFTLVYLEVKPWVRWALLGWALLFHMLPNLTFVGSWYLMYSSVGLHGTYFAVIMTHAVQNLPMALFLMISFVGALPRELIQAARMDGCTYAQVFWRIVFPLVRGGMIAATALTFIFSWSDFAIALTLTSRDTMTVPVAIATFAQEYDIRYGEMAAGTLLSIMPALVLILIGQNFIVRGLLAGAVK
ncbi:MAG: ABC transporter permease [Hoeflea sp.]|uniref:carbohydrate ABC transporter permease n=1 Tax=Hoeflea sp. TaxID=1940281 RepID=UPI000C114782|nr:carbohydrate ABC transporter permease [Hoeflea sp.]PHR20637.1 MAG: ABC transporter permease [Hoeflea sp.]